ncbi:energy-coupling factor ABC transporter ATP-binding protein [Lacrimispora sp. NSJ-141]|uniref:Energy-coupling factor ABC transporter ATP-binding protein n=1 Tax=Lientehia hominis TaxID=2897778 RepID=A0AAP2RGI6_9FIRM|nr:ABC transporter ATP-binding protein [Lientehia hominis]MCD2491557.1 energy-coupling factor ABC transporter ATP-binding protein [Lientehia hominis]
MRAVTVEVESFVYGGCAEPVLRNLDFFIEYGQIALLSGLSGSGKSTLLSLINGVIPRMASGTLKGTVRIDGEDVSEHSMSQISRKVGSVLQNAELQIVHQRVEDEIAFGCENFGIAPPEIEKRVSEGCRKMDLSRAWKTRTLSGGQKQKLITAATLAMETDILIFDEPLANLDQQGAEKLLELLQSLAREGKAVLLAEHRLDVVLPYVDVVWELKDGAAGLVGDKDAYLNSQISIISDDGMFSAGDRKTIMKINGIRKSFDTSPVLDGLDAQINKGERILLLGENGCGKSTFLQILARLQKADSGSVEQFIDSSLGKKAGRFWFRTVGVIYQNPNYQLFMPTVEEELSFGTRDKAYAMETAVRFGLEGLLSRHPHSLSEGQKRRVTIAAILAQRPDVLLLDEPTVGQDYKGLCQMVETINQIHKEQDNTMVTITHDFRCASALCDRAFFLEGGRVAREGGKELADWYFRQRLLLGGKGVLNAPGKI